MHIFLEEVYIRSLCSHILSLSFQQLILGRCDGTERNYLITKKVEAQLIACTAESQQALLYHTGYSTLAQPRRGVKPRHNNT